MKNKSILPYYFVVQGWMREELNLEGCDLSLFAIIYGFSQGLNTCDISLNFLSQLTGYAKNTVLSSLKRLQEKGYILIIKNTSLLSNKKQRNSYQVLRLPSGATSGLLNSSTTALHTDIIDILKNKIKEKEINKENIKSLKLEIIRTLDERLQELEEIARTKWIDD